MADNTANIGFEKQIWDAACVLRGNIDASEYKNVVLGLIFLKYISDRFEEKHKQLVEEGDGFEEDIDEYISEGIFFVPETARWSVVASKAHIPEIGTVIDNAMRAIEKENKRLKDILPKNFARPELDKRRLGDVVDLFTNIKISAFSITIVGMIAWWSDTSLSEIMASTSGKKLPQPSKGGSFAARWITQEAVSAMSEVRYRLSVRG